MNNIINWFEIPVSDMDRAIAFYSRVLDVTISQAELMGTRMGFFPAGGNAISGALVQGEDYVPAASGVLIYLNGGNDLQEKLDRIEPAQGKILVPKTLISSEMGYFAWFSDSEGNRVGLHSMN